MTPYQSPMHGMPSICPAAAAQRMHRYNARTYSITRDLAFQRPVHAWSNSKYGKIYSDRISILESLCVCA